MYNVEKNFKKSNPDARLRKAKDDWCDQLNDCYDALQTLNEDVLSAKFEIIRFFDEKKSNVIAFAKRFRLCILMRRGHLTLMDNIHSTNQFK